MNQTYDLRLTEHQVLAFIEKAEVTGAVAGSDHRDHALHWKRHNPLTDADVVLEIDFIWDNHTFLVESQMRDHDGEGENIPHSISEWFHGDDECSTEYLLVGEAITSLMTYVGEQEDKYALGVKLKTESIGGTALAQAFLCALKESG